MSKRKMTKDIIPEDFTLGLAITDAIPVLFFGMSAILAGIILKNPLFVAGALLCFFAGTCKVIWKFAVVLQRKNIWWMFLQMRTVMPLGFLMMAVSFAFYRSTEDISSILDRATSFPSAPLFGIGIIGMIMMLAFAFTLDSSKVKSNWIEQIINGLSQMAFFFGLLMMVL